MSDQEHALGPPERLHPLALLTNLGASLRGMWGMYAASGYFAVQGRWVLAVSAVTVFTLFSLLASVIRWHRFSFRVGPNEIRIDSGIFSRTHRSIPFDRIQDVTIEQGPVARLLGLARVGFETGSSGGSDAEKADEGALAAIPLARAGELREMVRAGRRLGQAPATAVADDGPTIYAMDLERVLLAGLFNFSLAIVGALFGASQTVGQFIGFDPFSRTFWDNLFAAGSPIGNFFLANGLLTVVAGSATLVLIGLGTGLVTTLLRDYRFRLDRRETALRRRRGLVTLTDVSLPLKRIQAAAIGSGPVRSRFGWSEVKLQSLAQDDSGKGEHVVAPLADGAEVERVLAAIDYRPVGTPDWQRVSKAYVWVLAAGLAPLLLIIALLMLAIALVPYIAGETLDGPIIGLISPVLAVIVAATAILVLTLIPRFLGWSRYGYAVDGDRLLVRSGWWRRRLRILPVRNIQSVEFRQSFVSRWFGLASLVIGVAGGAAGTHGVKALPAEIARALRRTLLSGSA